MAEDPVNSYGDDPYAGFNFLVEAGESGIKGMFTEVAGLKGDVEEFEIKEGGLNSRTHKFPGRVSWGPVTLKKGLGDATFFWDWWETVASESASLDCRKNVKITMLDRDNDTTLRIWNLKDAWPKSWEAPGMNSGSSELAIETLILNHAGVTESTS